MAAINAYVSDEIKDATYDEAERQMRSVSWVVSQALMLYFALRPVPIIGELHAKMTPTDWDEIEQRVLELKERSE